MSPTAPRVPWPLLAALLAAAHVATAEVSYQFTIPPGYSATVWLPAGLSLIAVLLGGNRMLLGVALAEVFEAVSIGLEYGMPRPAMAGFALAAAAIYLAQAWVGAALVRRTVALPSGFDDPRDILLLLLWGGPIAALCTSLPGPLLMRWFDLAETATATDVFNWWLGEVTGVTLTAPLLLVLLHRSGARWRQRAAVVALPVALGTAASLFAYQRVARSERHRVELQFAEQSQAMATRARTQVEIYEEGLRSISGLFASSQEVTADEFASFVAPFLERHTGVRLIAYAVPAAATAATTAAPAIAPRFVEPAPRRAALVGLDLATEPAIMEALSLARDQDAAVTTTRLPVFGRSPDAGFAMVVPDYRPTSSRATVDQRRAALRGYVVAMIALDELMAAVGAEDRKGELMVEWLDAGRGELDAHPPRPSPAAVVEALFADSTLIADALVEAAGRRWLLHVATTPAFARDFREWKAWTVLSGGLLFTSLLGAFALAGSGRSTRIEALVVARTAELERANHKLRTEIGRRLRSEKAVARHAEEVERSNAEKEVLLKEIHHRVKNNLQVISSLLNLQSRQISDPVARAAFKESQGRVRSMALFHEQIYRSRDLASIDLGDYLRNVASTLLQTSTVDAREIALVVDGDGVKAGIDLAISCGLIANELIVNAIKYAFADERPGTIRVAVASRDGGCELAVSDDGIGMPVGFDVHTAESFGLQLVITLVEQLEGTLDLAVGGGPAERPGTRFAIYLPRPRTGRSTPVPLPGNATPTPTPGVTPAPPDD